MWRGYHGSPVTIEAFCICPAQNLEGAKEVSVQPASGVYQRMKILDPLKRVSARQKLSHQNTPQFRGATATLFPLALVYGCGHNSNTAQFIASNPSHASPASFGITCCCDNTDEIPNIFPLRTVRPEGPECLTWGFGGCMSSPQNQLVSNVAVTPLPIHPSVM